MKISTTCDKVKNSEIQEFTKLCCHVREFMKVTSSTCKDAKRYDRKSSSPILITMANKRNYKMRKRCL